MSDSDGGSGTGSRRGKKGKKLGGGSSSSTGGVTVSGAGAGSGATATATPKAAFAKWNNEWKFTAKSGDEATAYCGRLELPHSDDTTSVTFSSLCHVAHINGENNDGPIPGAEGIVAAVDGNVVLKFKPAVHYVFKESLLWWAPVPDGDPVITSPAFDKKGSRYGCVRFTFPLVDVVEAYAAARNVEGPADVKYQVLGTTTFQQEQCHTTVLFVEGDAIPAPANDDAVASLDDARCEGTWDVYKHSDSHKWDQLDLAMYFPADGAEYCMTFDYHPGLVDYRDHDDDFICTKRCFVQSKRKRSDYKAKVVKRDGNIWRPNVLGAEKLFNEMVEAAFETATAQQEALAAAAKVASKKKHLKKKKQKKKKNFKLKEEKKEEAKEEEG